MKWDFFTDKDLMRPDFEIPSLHNYCTPDGKCSRCGSCCHGMSLPLSDQEAKKIAEYAKRKNYSPPPLYGLPAPFAEAGVMARCPFLSGGKCAVYSVRPLICRNFLCSKDFDDLQQYKVKRIAECKGEADLWQTFFPNINPLGGR